MGAAFIIPVVPFDGGSRARLDATLAFAGGSSIATNVGLYRALMSTTNTVPPTFRKGKSAFITAAVLAGLSTITALGGD